MVTGVDRNSDSTAPASKAPAAETTAEALTPALLRTVLEANAGLRAAPGLEGVSEGLFESELGGRIVRANERFCAFIGYTREELLQKSLAEITPALEPLDPQALLPRLPAGAAEYSIEKQFVHRNGEPVWALCRLSVARNAKGEAVRMLASTLDISARRRAEEHARLLDGLSQALATRSDPDEMMAFAAREVGRALRVERSSFPEWQDDSRHIVVRNDWFAPGLESRAGTYDLAEFGPAAWRERARQGSIAVDDVECDPDAHGFLPAFRALRIRSYASARFMRGSVTTACLTVTTEQPRHWRPEELTLLDNALARTWPLIERARAERETRETVRRLTLAMQAARLGDWRWEAADDTITLSGMPAEIIGVASGTRLARSAFREFLHPADRDTALATTEKALATGSDYRMEYRLRRPGGDYAWVEVTGTPVLNAAGKIEAAIGVMQEITQRKNAEAALQTRERELKLIGTHVPAVLSHWDRDHRLRFASQAFAARWGVAPESLVGKTVPEILGREAFDSVRSYLDRVLAGEAVAFEKEVPYDRIGPRYVQVSYAPELGDDGQVRGYLSAVIDLTERRRAELALRESEERLRMATQTGKIGLWDWDIVENRVTWTESLYSIHGISPEEFGGTAEAFVALVHPEDRLPVHRALQSALEHDVRYELEFRSQRPGGGIVWLFTNATVVRREGRPVRMVGATVDITARKTAELALRESETRFRTLASHAPVGIFLTDAEGGCVFVNESWRTMTGLGPDRARGTGWLAALHPDDRARVALEWADAVEARRVFAMEFRFLHPDGAIVWVASSAVPSRSRQGEVTGLIGTTVDITERKAAEDALRESEKRFRTLASHAPVGIFLTDPQGDTILVNESWSAMTGLPLEQARGRGWVRAVHPDDRATVDAEWNAATALGAASSGEFRFLRPDGAVTWVQGNAVQLRDDEGRLLGYIGTIVDVTERRQTEEKLRAQEAQLRLISNNAPIILAHCGSDERYRFVNRAYAEHFRVTSDEVVGRTIAAVLGERARAALAPHFQRVLAGETFECEAEIDYATIGRRFMRIAFTPEFGADGAVTGWLEAISDITERRRILDALRESEERFRQLADSMPQIVFAADAHGNPDYFNRRWSEFTHAAELAAGEKSLLALLHPDDHAWFKESWARSIDGGRNYEAEYRLRHAASGEYRWQLARALPVLSAAGEIVRWFGTLTDIHDWKLVQEELRRRTRSLEVLHRLGTALAAERDPKKILASVAEAAWEAMGAAFGAFFHRVHEGPAGMCTRYAVAGLPVTAFAADALPGSASGAAAGDELVRLDDAAASRRPHLPFGALSPAHPPVRSYLLIPVVSRDGATVGGLCFGHPEPARFTEDNIRIVTGIAAQAAIAIDNANLYTALSHELQQKTEAEKELCVAQEQLRAHAIELEQKVADRTASLREAIVQMEEFSYSVSHDLRAPLRAMNAYARALVEDYAAQLDETGRNHLERIVRSSERMERLTHDVLTYSRVGRADVQLSELNLEALLRDVLGHYSELQPPAAEVEIVRPLAAVQGHESSLGQCLGNLLTNAAKFVEPGVRPKIRVWTERRGERVRLWIQDNGIGIAPAHQGNLFRVFERAPTRRTYEGTGIGLAIVRKAVEKMGGSAGVESDGVNGSRFWIELSAAQP